MKSVYLNAIVISLIFGVNSLFAAPNNISVTVDGTVYQCTGTGGATPCDSAAHGFKSQLEYCYKSASGLVCAEIFWPKFKSANPNCIYSGMTPCLEYCYKSASGKVCADLCS